MLESQEHVFTECPFISKGLENEQYLSNFAESKINKTIAILVTAVDDEWGQVLDKFDP